MRRLFVLAALLMTVLPAAAQEGVVVELRPPAGLRPNDVWRAAFIGKQVVDLGGGDIGTVIDVVTPADPDEEPSAVVVALSGDVRRSVGVPWALVRAQAEAARVVVSDAFAGFARLRSAANPGLERWRPSWLDGRPARLADGRQVGIVDGFVFGPSGQVAQVGVRRPDGEMALVPRPDLHVGAEAVTVELTEPQFAQLPR
ncbi:MAG: hypothetical protein ACM31L_10600 [Actinomycetota bacterium]